MNVSLAGPVAVSLAVGIALGACNKAADTAARPAAITKETSCSLDGMLLADYAGPKAQIHYESGPPDFFCDTVEMFSIYLRPEQQRRVRALFVQDMGGTDWERPVDQWIDARTAFYVHGSRKRGSMGSTLASFAREEDARRFASQNGGRVLRFSEVTADLVALDGGALHDGNM